MKKAVVLILMVTLMLGLFTAAAAPSDDLSGTVMLSVGSNNAAVDGRKTVVDQNCYVVPFVENGATLVPIRFISESLGASVAWNENENKVTISNGGQTLEFVIGSNTAKNNGQEIALLAAAKVENDRTFVPLRVISECFGKQVFYSRGLIIISDTPDIYDPEADIDQLDRIIMDELGSLPSVDSEDYLNKLMADYNSRNQEYNDYMYSDALVMNESRAPMMDAAVAGGGASFGSSMPMPASVPQTAKLMYAMDEGAADYIGTNLQVEGVDEGDVVKTDGKYIYKVNDKKISIARAEPLEIVSEIAIPQNTYISEMYIDRDRLVTLSNYYDYPDGDINMPSVKIGYWGHNFVEATVYDISNVSSPKEIRKAAIEGYYISSRKVGDSLYFAANSYIYENIVPYISDTVAGGEIMPLDYRCIRYFPNFRESGCLNIGVLDVFDNSREFKAESYIGGGSTMYASQEGLYIATYNYGDKSNDYRSATDIFKFRIGNGQINYVAKGTVDGNVLNQFSMDEYNGNFRIATTGFDRNKQSNNLFILDGGMKPLGSITDIAPGERIYSVRYMGAKAYMVTFRQVDPLFVIDLSDPENPEILGQLKIPGYSDYLHPYDETHIIGIGKSADDKGFAQGLKMAIFDVSDFYNPKEMFKEEIGDRGTDTPLLYNHKALLFSKELNLLAFPVSLYKKTDTSFDYGMFEFQGLYVYNIDLENGFSLRGRLSHISEEEYKKFGNVVYGSKAVIERGLFINNKIFALSDYAVTANDFNSLELVDKVEY